MASISASDWDGVRGCLTLTPKHFYGPVPAPFQAWTEDAEAGVYHVPRFFGLERFGPAEHDDRTSGDACTSLHFDGTLTAVQETAMHAVIENHFENPRATQGAIVCMPCGFGKTVFAVALAARLRVRTFVLVHKTVIRDQWKASFERFSPGVRVGFVQGDMWQIDPTAYDVVIGMVMTLARRDVPCDTFDSFGLLVADEVHHMAAPVMNLAIRSFRTRRVLGLTATKDRPDGMTPVLHWCIGPEAYRGVRNAEYVKVSVVLFTGAARALESRGGRPLVAPMITQLAKHSARNNFLADRIAAFRNAGRVIMVLTDRLVQLDILRALVIARGIPAADVGIFKGGQRDADRREQLGRPVVMCSYGMANEGVDKTEADTCIMATPKARVAQCIGRIQRPCATKQTPLVVDVADDVSIFSSLRWTRQKYYSKEGYEVQVHPVTAPAEVWFE